MPLWNEIADRVFVRRYQPLDISVALVLGETGALLVDTRCNPREADEILRDAAPFGREITHVVNTHAHYDHTFGNQRFAETAVIFGHHLIPRHFAEFESPRLAEWQANPEGQPQYDWHGVSLTPPTELVESRTDLDIGNRIVRLIPLGPGHTDTDLVIQVPDAGVWIVGDVIEESGPPMYGSGSFPLDWPGQVETLAGLIADSDVVVPGHGAPVDRAFVRAQADLLGTVADGIREAFARSEPVELVAERIAGATALPLDFAEAGVHRGYSLLASGDVSG